MNPWPRNDYIEHAKQSGASDETALSAWNQAVLPQRAGLPSVLSLNHLAQHTQNSYQFLRAVVTRSMDAYRVFRIRKRSGGYRTICVPEHGLLRAQHWIDRFILSKATPHERSKAYSPGCSIVACAKEHAGCRWLIKCDVRQFFESISEIQVCRVFKELSYQPLVAFELARIATRTVTSNKRMRLNRWRARPGNYGQIPAYRSPQIGHLPQGAPTSPKLSNLAMRNFDESVDQIARSSGITYTRYADDLIFSVHQEGFDRAQAKRLIATVFNEMVKIGLRPHASKTVIAPPGARKIVLGLTVNDTVPRLTRDFRNRLKTHVHFVCKLGIVNHARNRQFDSVVGFREHLRGLLLFAREVEPAFHDKLMADLTNSDWMSL